MELSISGRGIVHINLGVDVYANVLMCSVILSDSEIGSDSGSNQYDRYYCTTSIIPYHTIPYRAVLYESYLIRCDQISPVILGAERDRARPPISSGGFSHGGLRQ